MQKQCHIILYIPDYHVNIHRVCSTVYVLAMVGHLKNVSPTFAQMPDRIPNVEFTTVSPTVANTMLAVRLSLLVIYTFNT